MHGEGFKHQDFYLCHILINLSVPDDPLLYIADLHRVRRRKKNKQSWQIKDLAALNYSAPQKLISRTDRLRFMKHYDPILANDLLFLKKVIKKTAQIRSHEEKNQEN
jgi:heptose I phosphotransferase